MNCAKCNSDDLIKKGFHRSKQRYGCKQCGRKFVRSKQHILEELRIMGIAIGLYYDGLSFRKVRIHLRIVHNYFVSKTTIWIWVLKYGALARKFLRKYKPKLSSLWHADEMVLVYKNRRQWYWDVIDNKTKFLVSGFLTKFRSGRGATRLFREARLMGGYPKTLITDGFSAYSVAVRQGFKQRKNPFSKIPKVLHIGLAKFEAPTNNNIIERFQGTLRERYKVMRGLKTIQTANKILDGFYVHYNFIRPHESLGDKTPAEAAGINLGLQNNWTSLMQLICFG